MNYYYGNNTDKYLDDDGLKYLITKLKETLGSGENIDLTNYYNKMEVNNLLSNIGSGVGVQSVELIDYELVITLTDSTIINLGNVRGATGLQGIQGEKGDTGIQGVAGTNGADGKGIISIVKTDTVDLVDTYTITYSDATTSIFTVTNGANSTNQVMQADEPTNQITGDIWLKLL